MSKIGLMLLGGIIGAGIGVGVGAVASAFIFKKKLNECLEDELAECPDFVEAVEKDRKDISKVDVWHTDDAKKKAEMNNNRKDILDYANEIKNYNTETEEETKMVSDKKLYVISDEAFGNAAYDNSLPDGDWNVDTLYYFTDGILAWDDGEIVEDFDGIDPATYLNEDRDYFYVRDENNLYDYEILAETVSYKEKFADEKESVND